MVVYGLFPAAQVAQQLFLQQKFLHGQVSLCLEGLGLVVDFTRGAQQICVLLPLTGRLSLGRVHIKGLKALLDLALPVREFPGWSVHP